jgi:hypothetical protein
LGSSVVLSFCGSPSEDLQDQPGATGGSRSGTTGSGGGSPTGSGGNTTGTGGSGGAGATGGGGTTGGTGAAGGGGSGAAGGGAGNAGQAGAGAGGTAGGAGAGGARDAGARPDSGNGDASDAGNRADSGTDSVVRFVAMGDTGKGNPEQLEVANAIKRKCDADKCDFVLLLGDNIYDSGVTTVDDLLWRDKFEIPYQAIDLPFYAVLGNHDYGGLGLGFEFIKGPVEVAYSSKSKKWKMPATHYTFQQGNVGFVAIDTNSILWSNIDHGSQAAWYPGAIAQLQTTWKIVFGHHPYLSNGTHGNAGTYTDLTGILFPQQLGVEVKSFMESHVCGTADVYLCGHDHSRQWLRPACGMELIVSGTGAETTALASRNPSFYDTSTLGFLYVVIRGKELRGQFINTQGGIDYERVLTKP